MKIVFAVCENGIGYMDLSYNMYFGNKMADAQTQYFVCSFNYSPKLHCGASCRLRDCSPYSKSSVTFINVFIINLRCVMHALFTFAELCLSISSQYIFQQTHGCISILKETSFLKMYDLNKLLIRVTSYFLTT